MEPGLQFLVITALTLTLTALLLVVKRTLGKNNAVSKSQLTGKWSTPLFTVQFDFEQIAAIRNLFDVHMTEQILQRLSDRVSSELQPTGPPDVSPTSIICIFSAADEAEANLLVGRALAALRHKLTITGIDFYISATSLVQSEAESADIAAASRMQIHAEPSWPADTAALMRELPEALLNGQVTLEYQPKQDLRLGNVESVEALLRWRRSDDGLVNTGQLIALLEVTGAIRDVTIWTINRAIADARMLRDQGHDTIVYVNMSGSLLSSISFCQTVLEMLANSDVRIGFEITETSVISDPDIAIENLRAFALAGISIAIDDFGAGLSSLEYLQQLPACELKIDRNFIAKLSSSNRNPLIVKATIDLAHALEMKVTAEGVDDPLCVALLKVMGCDMAQGYLISPPLSVNDLVHYLSQQDNSPVNELVNREIRQKSAI